MREAPRLIGWLLTGLSLLLFCIGPAAADHDFEVRRVETQLGADGRYRLDAHIDYDFSPEALEALEHGVPLTVLVHLQVRRAGAWIWEDSLLDTQLRRTIRYKPLSERYEVSRLAERTERSFVSREAALRALGQIEDLDLFPAERLDAALDYEVQLKTELDIEELPLPLRPMAYLKPSWKLSSGWTKWPLNP
ncbi:MAG: DUF4390 domain-containing protein [Chromatiaceae bacterium]|nr:DUF4390 domain-containing protein [Chromatiaceae bacterium]